MRTLDFIEIARLSVSTATQEYFSATTAGEFEKVTVEGDAERLPHPEHLRLRITGVDPQLVLPGRDRSGRREIASGNAPSGL